jgi:hypothetical protein
LSVGPVYERAAGRVVRAGVLAFGGGAVAPRPFWGALQQLARRADWLRATFALTSRPSYYGVARADGRALSASFRGTWQTPPRLTLLVAGELVTEPFVEGLLLSCLGHEGDGDDPFPPWRPGEPWAHASWEAAC